MSFPQAREMHLSKVQARQMSDLCRWSSAQLRQTLDVGLVKQVEAEKGKSSTQLP